MAPSKPLGSSALLVVLGVVVDDHAAALEQGQHLGGLGDGLVIGEVDVGGRGLGQLRSGRWRGGVVGVEGLAFLEVAASLVGECLDALDLGHLIGGEDELHCEDGDHGDEQAAEQGDGHSGHAEDRGTALWLLSSSAGAPASAPAALG